MGFIAVDEAFVGFSLTSAARNQEREPTSLMGARAMLSQAFDAARVGVEVRPQQHRLELRLAHRGIQRSSPS